MKMNKNIIKVVSIILALIFWFLITNKENPIETRRYDVPIQILNESVIRERKLHVVEAYINTVEVSVRGRQKDLEKVRAEDFRVTVDIKNFAYQGKRSVELSEPIYWGQENISYWISGKNTLDLNLESISSKELKIEYEANGAPYEGYSISSVEMVPDKISFENLTSIVDKAAVAKVSINIDRLNRDKTYKEELKIYDADGNLLELLPQNVMVDVKVTMRKEVELVLNYIGQPAYDFYIDEDDISWTPLKGYVIDVIGYKEVMESYNTIYTEPLDITGRTESFDGQVSFRVPEGLRLVGATTAGVHIGIKPYVYKTIEIHKDDIYVNKIYIDNNLDWDIRNDTVTMVVKGKFKDVQNLENADFSPHITLPIRDGDYPLPLQVTMPDGLTLVSAGIVDLHIDMKKKITVDRENINIINKNEEQYDYVINDLKATITLNGPSEILEGLTDEDLNLYVDVANLKTGIHRLSIRLNNVGMNEVTIKNTTNVSVKITPKTEGSSSQETSSASNG